MKYKIGDKVLIRKDLVTDECGSDSVVSEMLKYRGKIATIKRYTDIAYMIDLDGGSWGWTNEMFKGKVDGKKIKAPKVNFLLKYDLDEDPIEEFETMKEVDERINWLVENESSLRKDSIVIYEVKAKHQVSIETKINKKLIK